MPLRGRNGKAPDARAGRAGATIAARLTFQEVERRYAAVVALAGVSLDVAPGEVVCLLGPSGCGKTTLLRIAAGIERPTGGRVLINGQEASGPTRFVLPEKRNVGLMFQDFALFPHLSLLDNVAFGLKFLPREEARAEALAALARVGLERSAGCYPHILSGGEQQRVALARAIVPRPAVMLMDEPFSGLDMELRERLQEETLALLRETRATCLIVTHAPAEAIRLGDRVAVMRAGRLVQAGRQGRGALSQPRRPVRGPALF
ncbi:MAG TPA: ABC transporter ATP-binding protein [Hyphomicrobiaceae bacterium]|nr:ABC transporter ATP-binding protein [Hyphomicrobiaceae bacterium]